MPEYRDLPLAELLPAAFPDLQFVRVVRANKVRQAVSLWKAVQTATWRQDEGPSENGSPPYQSFIEQHRPNLRFHYGAIAHLLDAAHVCDGLVKGLKHPDWPLEPWEGLKRLVLMLVEQTARVGTKPIARLALTV